MNISHILVIDALDLDHCRGAVVLEADRREKLRLLIFVFGFDHGLRTVDFIFSPVYQPNTSSDACHTRLFHRFRIALELSGGRFYADFFSIAVQGRHMRHDTCRRNKFLT